MLKFVNNELVYHKTTNDQDKQNLIIHLISYKDAAKLVNNFSYVMSDLISRIVVGKLEGNKNLYDICLKTANNIIYGKKIKKTKLLLDRGSVKHLFYESEKEKIYLLYANIASSKFTGRGYINDLGVIATSEELRHRNIANFNEKNTIDAKLVYGNEEYHKNPIKCIANYNTKFENYVICELKSINDSFRTIILPEKEYLKLKLKVPA